MKILLFKLGALGDLLMTTPLARQLRAKFPDARIDCLVGESFARILKGNPNVNDVLTFPEAIFYRRDIPGFLRLVARIRKSRYDAILVLDRHWIFPLTAFLFGADRRIGFDRMGREGILLTDKVRFEAVRHEIHYYLDLLETMAPADRSDTKMDFFLSPEEVEFADRFWREHALEGRRVVCLAPGGGANPGQDLPLKRWPVEHYAELARRLEESGLAVVMVGGPTDREAERFILSRVKVRSAVGAALGESAALLARAHAVVCSDGGPMHVAAAVNDRVVSIFGPTDPRRLAPLNGFRFLWKPGECGPCYDIYGRIGGCPDDRECMKAIPPDEVMDVLGRISGSGPPAVPRQ